MTTSWKVGFVPRIPMTQDNLELHEQSLQKLLSGGRVGGRKYGNRAKVLGATPQLMTPKYLFLAHLE